MAAVRCLARRLGRTLATVAEERRQLVPTRFFSEHARDTKEMREKTIREMTKRTEKMYDAIYNRTEIPTITTQRPSVQASQEHDLRPHNRYALRIRGVFDLAIKLTLAYMLVAFWFSPSTIQHENINEGNKTREDTTNN